MKYGSFLLLILFIPLIFVSISHAVTPVIEAPEMEIVDNNIMISLSVSDASSIEDSIKSGIHKEIIFTVELLRNWNFWPDEFIVSKSVRKIIKYDNLREQYLLTSDDGLSRTEHSYRNYKAVRNEIFNISGINLANIRELDPGSYYVRTIVESKSIQQLPVIGPLMHLMPEVEMSLAKESQPFKVGPAE